MSALGRVVRGRTPWVVAGVAVLVLNVVIAWGARSGGAGLSADEQAALSSARARVGTMLTFSHTDLEADLSVASANATGAFRTKYVKLLRSMVLKAADSRKITTHTTVTEAAVRRAVGRRVQVITFISSRTTVGSRTPVVNRSRLLVTMQDVRGQWLVSGIEPA